jgi:hypothetical protein
MSTGRSKTVARSEVKLIMATTLTMAERSLGFCQVKVVIVAAKRQRTTATA